MQRRGRMNSALRTPQLFVAANSFAPHVPTPRPGRMNSALQERLHPTQTCRGAGERSVFAADPAAVAQFIEQREEVAVVDLAVVGLVPPRHARDLDMADVRQP